MDFADKIKVCPECEGWGVQKGSDKHCFSCHGRGVYIVEKGTILAFDMPTFIDYALRIKIKLIRNIVLVLLIIGAVSSLVLIVYILFQIFR